MGQHAVPDALREWKLPKRAGERDRFAGLDRACVVRTPVPPASHPLKPMMSKPVPVSEVHDSVKSTLSMLMGLLLWS